MQGVLSAHMSGGSGSDDSAQQWLQEQKLKLVAQKKVEREAETAQYKAAKQGKVRHVWVGQVSRAEMQSQPTKQRGPSVRSVGMRSEQEGQRE